MNHVYRIVWSAASQTFIAVAENASGKGKRSLGKVERAARALALAAIAAAASPALAGPAGGSIAAGQGAITQSGSSTTINQASSKLVINWQNFNIGAGESVAFHQPGRDSIALNRVLGAGGTEIHGSLSANGQVFIVNPNGVLFGKGASVNVGGLAASTLGVSDSDFMGGNFRFSGSSSARVVNQGAISAAPGGYAALIGASVSNAGSIDAPSGSAALAAGSDVTLTFDSGSMTGVRVSRGALEALAENGGLIRAEGGRAILTAGGMQDALSSAVNNTGVVEARSARSEQGVIRLEGGLAGTVENHGVLDASGSAAGQRGGSVKVLGERVALRQGSSIDVSGEAGGGEALVGGNFLGAGPERASALSEADSGSLIKADALGFGQGGRVAVWSDGSTRFGGRVSARGGSLGGAGGEVETSGAHLKIESSGSVDTLAPKGAAGQWLLDPQDFVIGGFNPGDGDIDGAQITTALQSSNVTIKTGPSVSCQGVACANGRPGNGDIILAQGSLVGGFDWQSNTTLTLSAYRNVELRDYANADAAFSVSGNIVFRADNTGTGVGTVIFSPLSNVYGSPNGSVDIYYNPASYAAPTHYAGMTDTGGNPIIYSSHINERMLVNVSVSVAGKTYDGTTAAALAGATPRSALPAGVTLDLSGASAAFSSKNAGARSVTVTGAALSGLNASSYALNGLDGGLGFITPAPLAVIGVSAANKTYDGSASASLFGTASVSPIGADSIFLTGSGSASFADKNAGAGKAVSVSGYSLSGLDALNYTLIQPSGLTATISKATLTPSGLSVSPKTYDGNPLANLSMGGWVSPFGSDAVSLSGSGSAAFADKNAGYGKPVTVSLGSWALSGPDAANYALAAPSGLTGDIFKAPLSVSGLAAQSKIYDGSDSAIVSGTPSASGALGADAVSLSGWASGVFDNKNAGSNKTVSLSGLSLSGADAGNYTLSASLSANILKADLFLTGLSANHKTYDGTASATLSGSASILPFGTDAVSISGTGSAFFTDKNVGFGKLVAVAGYALSGPDAANYNLLQPTGLFANIAPAPLSLQGVFAASKTYDGTTSATLSGSAYVNPIGSDAVSVSGSGSAAFLSKNAGSNKTVIISGFSLSGADADNYSLSQPTGSTADIHKANLAVFGVGAANKAYDGSTAATLFGTASVTPLGADEVFVTGSGSGAFSDKNAGLGKAVAVSGFSLGGADALNYTLIQPSGIHADIGRAALSVSGLLALDKTYDGSAAAALSGVASISPFGADIVSLAGSASGSFADKNAGSGKPVTVAGYSLSGPDAANYTLAPLFLSASINKAALAVSGLSAAGKTYDGSTAATLAGQASVAGFGSDEVSVDASSLAAAFLDKNAGLGKQVAVTGISLAGADAANYHAAPLTLSADIAPKALSVSASAQSKTYDGLLTAQATLSDDRVAGDDLAVSGVAAFADKNAGLGKTVTVSGLSLSGADAANYALAQGSATALADIFKRSLAVSGVSAQSKTYDGTLAAVIDASAASFAGAVAGDDLSVDASLLSGSFLDKNAGSGKAVMISGLSLSGADAANYEASATGASSADILARSLHVAASALGKTYDGSTLASLSFSDDRVAGDAIVVSGSGAFADKNAGLNKTVSIFGVSISGADSGNYTLAGHNAQSSADIAKKSVSIEGVAAIDKIYDGSALAELDASGARVSGAIAGDQVFADLSGTSAAFADKHAGLGKAVAIRGAALSGADASNYSAGSELQSSAGIGRRALSVSASAQNKVYDGSAAATAALSDNRVAGDELTLSGVAAFSDKNAGSGKTVTVSGLSASGADAGNYLVAQSAQATAEIAKKSVSVLGLLAQGKTYDGSAAARLDSAGARIEGALLGDDVALDASAASALFADKNAGLNKAVAVGGLGLKGSDAANYEASFPASLAADIARKSVTVSGLAVADKAFDGSRSASLNAERAALEGVLAGDAAALDLSGARAEFDSAAPGSAKTVMASGLALSGADAANYELPAQRALSASILAAPAPEPQPQPAAPALAALAQQALASLPGRSFEAASPELQSSALRERALEPAAAGRGSEREGAAEPQAAFLAPLGSSARARAQMSLGIEQEGVKLP